MLDFLESQRSSQKRKKAKKLKLVLLLMLGLAIVGGVAALARASFLTVSEIDVDGNKLLSDQKIQNQVHSFLQHRGLLGNILFPASSSLSAFIEKGQLAQELMRENPAIAEATVVADVANKRVEVLVREREQYGAWCQERLGSTLEERDLASSAQFQLHCEWFDPEGVVFFEAPSLEGALIRKVIDRSGSFPQKGELVLDASLVPHLREIFDFLEESGIGVHTLLLKDRTSEEIESYHPPLPPIYFSLRYDPSYALTGFSKIAEPFSSLEYVDVRVKNRVYYK